MKMPFIISKNFFVFQKQKVCVRFRFLSGRKKTFFFEEAKLRNCFFLGERKRIFLAKMESNGVSGASGGGGGAGGGAAAAAGATGAARTEGEKAYADSIMASINQNDDRKLFVGSLAWSVYIKRISL